MDELWRYYDSWMSKRDTRADGWLFMDSPFPTVFSVLFYLIVVTQGPKVMQSHKAFDLKNVLIAYNFSLVVLSVYMLVELFLSSWTVPNFSLSCEPVDYSDNKSSLRLLNVIWCYYFSKIIEFLDTFFFVLRKKKNQITFLHIFHHSTMPFLWWVCTRFVGGGEAYFSATLNSLIHIMMYSYYMLTAMGPAMQPYLWWKKYMTSLQLLQFGIVLMKTIGTIIVDCGYPLFYAYILVVYMLILIALFSNFYYQTYLQRMKDNRKMYHNQNVKTEVNGDKRNGEDINKSTHPIRRLQRVKRLD